MWTALRQHPKIVEAVAATGAGDQASGIVMKEAVAELFEVDRVLVGMAWYQSAKRGQADAFARLWGKHACAITRAARHGVCPRSHAQVLLDRRRSRRSAGRHL